VREELHSPFTELQDVTRANYPMIDSAEAGLGHRGCICERKSHSRRERKAAAGRAKSFTAELRRATSVGPRPFTRKWNVFISHGRVGTEQRMGDATGLTKGWKIVGIGRTATTALMRAMSLYRRMGFGKKLPWSFRWRSDRSSNAAKSA